MHFTLIILVGKRVAFFSSWVSDLYVLICGSASASHGTYQTSGNMMLYATYDNCTCVLEGWNWLVEYINH